MSGQSLRSNDSMTTAKTLYNKRFAGKQGRDKMKEKAGNCPVAFYTPSTSDISRVLNSPGLHAHALVSDSRGGRFQHGGGSEKELFPARFSPTEHHGHVSSGIDTVADVITVSIIVFVGDTRVKNESV